MGARPRGRDARSEARRLPPRRRDRASPTAGRVTRFGAPALGALFGGAGVGAAVGRRRRRRLRRERDAERAHLPAAGRDRRGGRPRRSRLRRDEARALRDVGADGDLDPRLRRRRRHPARPCGLGRPRMVRRRSRARHASTATTSPRRAGCTSIPMPGWPRRPAATCGSSEVFSSDSPARSPSRRSPSAGRRRSRPSSPGRARRATRRAESSGTDLSTAEAWHSERGAIRDRVVKSMTMPPEGHPLSETDRAAIRAWVESPSP